MYGPSAMAGSSITLKNVNIAMAMKINITRLTRFIASTLRFCHCRTNPSVLVAGQQKNANWLASTKPPTPFHRPRVLKTEPQIFSKHPNRHGRNGHPRFYHPQTQPPDPGTARPTRHGRNGHPRLYQPQPQPDPSTNRPATVMGCESHKLLNLRIGHRNLSVRKSWSGNVVPFGIPKPRAAIYHLPNHGMFSWQVATHSCCVQILKGPLKKARPLRRFFHCGSLSLRLRH